MKMKGTSISAFLKSSLHVVNLKTFHTPFLGASVSGQDAVSLRSLLASMKRRLTDPLVSVMIAPRLARSSALRGQYLEADLIRCNAGGQNTWTSHDSAPSLHTHPHTESIRIVYEISEKA